jgi:hypothetical protein
VLVAVTKHEQGLSFLVLQGLTVYTALTQTSGPDGGVSHLCYRVVVCTGGVAFQMILYKRRNAERSLRDSVLKGCVRRHCSEVCPATIGMTPPLTTRTGWQTFGPLPSPDTIVTATPPCPNKSQLSDAMKALSSDVKVMFCICFPIAARSLGVQQFTQVALPLINEAPRVPKARSDGFQL